MEGTRKLLVDKVNEFANSGGGGGDLQPTKESIANFFQKILEYLLHTFDPVWGFFVQTFDGISWGSFVESVGNFFQKLLEYLLHAFDPVWGFFVQTFDGVSWGSFVEKFDSIWGLLVEKWSLIQPDSETLHHWLRGGFLRGTGKMMKAPGRMGVTMLRASFEANPLGYFRALRAGGPHLS
ncbi:uncharacterized protein A4U43_C08F20750 [Asparagus officinalis]|nr:uncharacterized protein A4U43_C08F20750 [Asparagus officinalis]